MASSFFENNKFDEYYLPAIRQAGLKNNPQITQITQKEWVSMLPISAQGRRSAVSLEGCFG
jgi:hypothetical protein